MRQEEITCHVVATQMLRTSGTLLKKYATIWNEPFGRLVTVHNRHLPLGPGLVSLLPLGPGLESILSKDKNKSQIEQSLKLQLFKK